MSFFQLCCLISSPRYFYLICFGTYSLEVGASGFQKSFTSWMDERPHLRTMIEEGKDKLEWYRQVDPAKLNTLKDLINAPNYKDNLATLIRTIYEFAFLTYAGTNSLFMCQDENEDENQSFGSFWS